MKGDMHKTTIGWYIFTLYFNTACVSVNLDCTDLTSSAQIQLAHIHTHAQLVGIFRKQKNQAVHRLLS